MYTMVEDSRSFGTEEGIVCISQCLGLEVRRDGTGNFTVEEWEAQFDIAEPGEAAVSFHGELYDAVLCFGCRDWQGFVEWWSSSGSSAPGELLTII